MCWNRRSPSVAQCYLIFFNTVVSRIFVFIWNKINLLFLPSRCTHAHTQMVDLIISFAYWDIHQFIRFYRQCCARISFHFIVRRHVCVFACKRYECKRARWNYRRFRALWKENRRFSENRRCKKSGEKRANKRNKSSKYTYHNAVNDEAFARNKMIKILD